MLRVISLMLRLLLTIAAVVGAASSVFANDEQDCFQGQEPELRIKGCSDMIQRSPNDPTAYHNRAFAYELAGDLDNAIADYSKVIVLAPNNASAYANRGRAYASQRDYVRAIEDETKAQELIAKANTPAVIPEVRKVPVAAAVAHAAAVKPKKNKAPNATNKAGQQSAAASWWSWLWGNGADQTGGKRTKP